MTTTLSRRLPALLAHSCAALAISVVVAACASSGSDGPHGGTGVEVGGGVGDGTTGSASCAATLVYDGHAYWGHGELRRDPTTTGRVLRAAIPACDDTGGQASAVEERVVVAELAEVRPETAVLLHNTVFVRDGRELPAAADQWFRAPRCTTPGEVALTGDWLGVIGEKRPRFDGELRPPYRLRMHVTDGPRQYLGATVDVHARGATDPQLAPRDVRRSLWTGGQVFASVTCAQGRFHAVSLRTPAGSGSSSQ